MLLSCLLLNWPAVLFSQALDSVCLHRINSRVKHSIFIRTIDSIDFTTYQINSKLFDKKFKNDSIFIIQRDNSYHQRTAFVGEYTRKDSVHFIDFLIFTDETQFIKINGCNNARISRNNLPELERLEMNADLSGFLITAYTMYLGNDKVMSTFHITQANFPDDVKKTIMKLRVGDIIIFDGIKVKGPDNEIRTVQNPPGYIIIE